jgi:uncharacterized membrane protein
MRTLAAQPFWVISTVIGVALVFYGLLRQFFGSAAFDSQTGGGDDGLILIG